MMFLSITKMSANDNNFWWNTIKYEFTTYKLLLSQVTEFLPTFQSDGDDEVVHKLLKLRYNPDSGQIIGDFF